MTRIADRLLRILPCVENGERYGLELDAVRAIHIPSDMTGTPKGSVLGWLRAQFSEHPIAVVNLSRLLGRQSREPAPGGRIILLHGAAAPMAFRVDNLANLISVNVEDRFPLSVGGFHGVVGAFDCVLRCDGTFLPQLSVSRLAEAFVAVAEGRDPLPGSVADRAWAQDNGAHIESKSLRSGSHTSPKRTRPPGRLAIFSNGSPQGGGSVLFCFSVSQVFELISWQRPQPFSGMPRHFLGLLSLRGRPVPVVDLSDRLGLGASSPGAERLVVVRAAFRQLVAIPVANTSRLVNFPVPFQRYRGKCDFDSSLAHGVFEVDQKPLIIPNLERLLAGVRRF